MKHLVLIDNYDSFTFNLAQAFQVLGVSVSVIRNDAKTADQIVDLEPDYLVVSPGPGGPAGTGVCGEVVQRLRGQVPVLGVCLGHQLLASQCGARVLPAPEPVHGKAWPILHDGVGIFAGLPEAFPAARYHSLTVVVDPWPEVLRPLAWTGDGCNMGFGIPGEATWGVQFHPESYMTPDGPQLLERFLRAEPCPPVIRPSDEGARHARGADHASHLDHRRALLSLPEDLPGGAR